MSSAPQARAALLRRGMRSQSAQSRQCLQHSVYPHLNKARAISLNPLSRGNVFSSKAPGLLITIPGRLNPLSRGNVFSILVQHGAHAGLCRSSQSAQSRQCLQHAGVKLGSTAHLSLNPLSRGNVFSSLLMTVTMLTKDGVSIRSVAAMSSAHARVTIQSLQRRVSIRSVAAMSSATSLLESSVTSRASQSAQSRQCLQQVHKLCVLNGGTVSIRSVAAMSSAFLFG